MPGVRLAVCLLGVAALIASCRQDQPVVQRVQSAEPSFSTLGASDTFEVWYGETIVVKPGVLEVTFDTVLEDSRCPRGAQCFWAGNALIQLRAVSLPFDTHMIVLSGLFSPPVDTLGHTFRLLGLDPYPDIRDLGVGRSLSDYCATLLIIAREPAE